MPWDRGGSHDLSQDMSTTDQAINPLRRRIIEDMTVDAQTWLVTDVLARLQDHPAKRIDELLPWNLKRARPKTAAWSPPIKAAVALSTCLPAVFTAGFLL